MLVEINLLPQKEPKKYNFLIVISSFLVLFLLIGGLYYWQTHSIKDQLSSLDRQISMTKKITQKQEQASKTVESTNSVNQLKSAIEWANDYPIQTIPVMRQLTSLLPERGFIQSFAYTEAGTITLTVQFDSGRAAAYFLDSLNQSKWISEAGLSSLAAAEAPTDSTTAATATNQTSTTDTTASTTTQTDTTNSNQTTTVQDTSGATASSNNQTSTTTDSTVNQDTTANSSTNSGSINNTSTTKATTSNTTGTATDPNILPRYTGQFEIKLNTEYVKKSIKKSKTDEKGVTGS